MEIAKELLLSESTIRQETVRIYRILGVGNRQDAVKRGPALGILGNSSTSTGL
jgi:ATP/maltotriose-dependent transcriptional regulator MalT